MIEFSVFIINIGTNFQKGTCKGHGRSHSLGRCKSSLLVSRPTHGSTFLPSSYKFLHGVILFLFHQFSIFVMRSFGLPFFYLPKLSCSLGFMEEVLFVFPKLEMSANWDCIVYSEKVGRRSIVVIYD